MMKKQEWPIVIAIAAVALVVMMLVQRPNTAPPQVAPIPTSNPIHTVQHDTFMVYDQSTWKEMYDATEDRRLINLGKAVTIPAGIQVTLLNVQDDSWVVRIQNGEYAGQRGYIKGYAFQ